MNKNDYRALLLKLTEPLKSHFSNGKARVIIDGHHAWYEDISAQTEAFARPLWGLVPFWAGGGSDAEFEANYLEGIINGTDKNHPEYWGECTDCNQRFVEMAAFAYGMLMSPEKIWEPLTDKQKANLTEWLWQINEKRVCDSNWIFFRVLVNAAFIKCGIKEPPASFTRDTVITITPETKIKSDLDRIDEFYLGNGWYQDGVEGQKDYYVAFALHFYGLIFAIYMEEEYPDRARVFKQRAYDFAQDFIYWFAEDGEALPYGRSLTYRFAQVSFWSACILADVKPFSTGVMKGIIERNLEQWEKSCMLDGEGLLTVGYKYPNLLMAEHYNATGSPYWGLKVFAMLALSDNHEFWSISPLPLPELDALKSIPQADMIISRSGGEVTAYTAGTHKSFACGQIVPKYLKFAYSTKFGFNVMRSMFSIEEAACDSMLCFEADGIVLVRRFINSYKVGESSITISWSPCRGIDVETQIISKENGHERIHRIHSDISCIAYDCGFAVSNADEDECSAVEEENGASAKNKFSSCTVIGGAGKIISASPNTNIMYPKTVIPSVKHIISEGYTVIKTTVITG